MQVAQRLRLQSIERALLFFRDALAFGFLVVETLGLDRHARLVQALALRIGGGGLFRGGPGAGRVSKAFLLHLPTGQGLPIARLLGRQARGGLQFGGAALGVRGFLAQQIMGLGQLRVQLQRVVQGFARRCGILFETCVLHQRGGVVAARRYGLLQIIARGREVAVAQRQQAQSFVGFGHMVMRIQHLAVEPGRVRVEQVGLGQGRVFRGNVLDVKIAVGTDGRAGCVGGGELTGFPVLVDFALHFSRGAAIRVGPGGFRSYAALQVVEEHAHAAGVIRRGGEHVDASPVAGALGCRRRVAPDDLRAFHAQR